jgi:HAD superfamily hydrolase (TIGR01509 family)
MKLAVKGVLFDLDGVVLKSMEQHLQAWQFAFDQIGLHLGKEEFYKLEGRGVRSVVDDLARKYKLSADLKPGIIETKMAYYNRIYKPEFYSGLFELLELLSKQKIKAAIITGANRARIDELLEGHLKGFFEAAVTSDDVAQTKPFPEPYLKGAALLKLNPAECLVIENAPLGIRSAKEAGMTVIAVRTTLPDKYLRQADYIVDDLVQVLELVKGVFIKGTEAQSKCLCA